MLTRLFSALFLLLLPLSDAFPSRLTFPPSRHECTSGIRASVFQPSSLTCTSSTPLDFYSWTCTTPSWRKLFFKLDHFTLHCTDVHDVNTCFMHYHQLFTLLSELILFVLAVLSCGVVLALSMYIALLRLTTVHNIDLSEDKAPLLHHSSLQQSRYGSFGGRLYTLADVSDTLKAWLDLDTDDEDDQHLHTLPQQQQQQQQQTQYNTMYSHQAWQLPFQQQQQQQQQQHDQQQNSTLRSYCLESPIGIV